MNTTTISEEELDRIYLQIVSDSFPSSLDETDQFLLFAVLYSYTIVASDQLKQIISVSELHPLTQRGTSNIFAQWWLKNNKNSKDERADYVYWYWKWNKDWNGDKHFEQLSSEEEKRLEQVKSTLEKHPYIKELILSH